MSSALPQRIEEAAAYHELIDASAIPGAPRQEIAKKPQPHVANTLRLLKLPESSRRCCATGGFDAGHARAVNAADGARARRNHRRELM